MNIYVVTEGKTEKIVYPHWISSLNPSLTQVNRIDQVSQNNFFIISAQGYPQIFEIIDAAIEDVNQYLIFQRLVISLDSDELSFHEKMEEISNYVKDKSCNAQIFIIIQHFCFETWALGNRLLIRRNPQSARLREYLKIHNVRQEDPENLPAHQNEGLTRSQFAERYLRAAFNDRYTNLTYSKGSPEVLVENGYFFQVKKRFLETEHLSSLDGFIKAFQ